MSRFKSNFAEQFVLQHHMLLLLLGTGLSGALSNFALAYGGFERIVLRYPLSVIDSYIVFLVLMRLWLGYIRGAYRTT